MNLNELSQEQLNELLELQQLKNAGRLKVKGETKSRDELLAYNHYRQNRLNHYVNSMYNTIKENGLINEVKKFDKSIDYYLDIVKSELEKNPNAKVSKKTKATLPSFSVFEQ